MNLSRGHDPGYKLRDRYQIEKQLSEQGTFGITYKACDRFFLRDCIVKQLKLNDLPIAKRLFDDEYKHLFTLNSHPQVPNLLDYFEEQGEYYLVQEFIDGNDLSREIRNGQSISEENAKYLVKEILEILVPVHKLGLIHRDIKPQNIMRRRADDKLILIDFGAVKKITENYKNNNNQLTVFIGTHGYMPKEQENGRPTLASDIYAVGIIGIFALLGMHPDGLKNSENEKIIWRNRIQVTPEFASILDKMVHPKSNMRYSNAMKALKDIYKKLPELPKHYTDEDLNLNIKINSPFICVAENQSKQEKNISEAENSDKQRTFGQKLWNFANTWKFE